jgi:branched-chain amino acid transport system permease protein
MEILILSITRGAVYALVAAGFVLVFSVGGVLNLAHGTLFMLGAYFTYIYFTFVFASAGTIALLASIALAIASVCVTALLLFFVLLRRKISSISYVMVMSLAVALFVEQILKVHFGTTSTGVPPLLRGSEEIFGTRILSKELLLLPVSFVALGGLWLFLNHTRMGRAVEAVAQSRDGAILVGIDPDRALALTIAISAGLAGLAGTLVAPLVTVSPSIWSYWLVKAFAIAILGGLGSLPGAVIAAFLLSFVEIATTFAASDQYADLVALFVIVLILFFKPSGLMGARRA